MGVDEDYLEEYQRAEELVEKGRYQEAASHYTLSLEMNPQFRDAYISLANLYIRMGKTRRARGTVRRMLRNMDDEETLYLASVLLHQAGDFKNAKKYIERAMKMNEKPDYWIVLGNVYFGLERYDRAEECYDRALKLNPRSEEAWNNKGFLYFTQGDFERAIYCYERAIDINPSYRQAWYNMGYAYHAKGELSKAIYHYWRALRLDSRDEVAWNNMGNALYNLGRYMESIPYFMKSVKINPRYEIAWNNIGNALDRMGMHKLSIPFHEKALDLNPKFDYAWHAKGHALCELGRYEESLEFLERAIELNPEYAETWYWRGFALYNLERYEDAIESLKKAVEIDEDIVKAWELIGDIYLNLGYHREAWDYYENALKRGNREDRARIYMKLGKYEDALNYVSPEIKAKILFKLGKYEEILKIEARDKEIRYMKCLALEVMGKYHKALREIEGIEGEKFDRERKFIKYLLGEGKFHMPRDEEPDYYLRIGNVMMETGNYEGAIELFSDIKSKESYYFLGEAYISQGDLKKGIKYLEISAGMGFDLAIDRLVEVKKGEKIPSKQEKD